MEQQISDLLGYWLKITYRNICNYLDSRLEEHGLSNAQLGVLLLLWETDGLSQKQIQQVLGIQPASLTHLMKGLEAKGLITRRADAIDTRMNRIYLTEAGEALKQEGQAITMAGEEAARSGFSPEEVNLLISWLKRVNKNLGEL